MDSENNSQEITPASVQGVSNTLFYFTGTGNSLWAARALARELGNTEIISMVNWEEQKRKINSSVVGIVFPVHVWGVPRRVLEFLDELNEMSPEYIFAIATNGGQVSNTLVQLKKVMASRALVLNSGWSVELPSNYIPWGGPGSPEKQIRLFQAAGLKLAAMANTISHQLSRPVEKGPLWQRIIFSAFYKMTYPRIQGMDSGFWVDERCDHCSLCVKVCPAKNLTWEDGKLVWQNHCDQCLACLQWCPQEALQYGKKTPAYARYHHPEIKFKDIIKR